MATTLESGILSVVENLENAKTKFFSINGGDLSETRTIQLSIFQMAFPYILMES